MKVPATYVSSWDGGTEIESSCMFDTETNEVTDIESVDVDHMDLNVCEREYIVLPDGTELDVEQDGLKIEDRDDEDDDELDEPANDILR
jgi:hypothetical protein